MNNLIGVKKLNIIADNFTLSNPVILSKLQQRDKKYFYDFFEKILKTTDIIDVNLGQFKKNIRETIEFVFNLIYEIHDFTIIIDSVNPDIINYAISHCSKPPVLNSISFDSKKFEQILPIAKENNLEIIALVMDKRVPLTLDEKIALTLDIVNVCNEYGISTEKIIVDPVVVPLGWDNGTVYNANNLEYLKFVKDAVASDLRTVCGLSNLTTGATGIKSVKKLDAFYLAMAYMNNLDFALVNVFNRDITNVFGFIKILENKEIFTSAIFDE